MKHPKDALLPIAEYLSMTGDVANVALLKTMEGKCIMKNHGGKSYNTIYFLPKYLIEEVDMENSKLIVKEFTYELIKKYPTHENFAEHNIYCTFKPTVSNKTKKLNIKMDGAVLKIGTSKHILRADKYGGDITSVDKLPFDINTLDNFEILTASYYD